MPPPAFWLSSTSPLGVASLALLPLCAGPLAPRPCPLFVFVAWVEGDWERRGGRADGGARARVPRVRGRREKAATDPRGPDGDSAAAARLLTRQELTSGTGDQRGAACQREWLGGSVGERARGEGVGVTCGPAAGAVLLEGGGGGRRSHHVGPVYAPTTPSVAVGRRPSPGGGRGRRTAVGTLERACTAAG